MQRNTAVRLVALLLVGFLAILIAFLSGAAENHPPDWPDIVFAKSTSAVCQLYGVMSDGTALDRLFPWDPDVSCSYPVFDPSRRTLAFTSGNRSIVGQQDGIYRLDLDSQVEELLVAGSSLRPLQWSPTGESLLIQEGSASVSNIWRIDHDGGGLVLVAGDGVSRNADARWLSDGSRIVLISDRDDPGNPAAQHIWSVEPDGGSPLKITGGSGPYWSPRPSPDGLQIAFALDGNIWVMDSDGSNAGQLTGLPNGDESLPKAPWSPDANHILFSRYYPLNHSQTWVMDRDGSNQTQLSSGTMDDWPEDWSPDGAEVLYWWDGLWVMDADGTNHCWLGDSEVDQAIWRAAGLRRVYLPYLTGAPNSDITAAVVADAAGGIAEVQFEVLFDPAILECTGVSKGSLLGLTWAMSTPVIDNVGGSVLFSASKMFGSPLPPGGGELFTLFFHVQGTAPPCVSSPLHFVQCLVSDEFSNPIFVTPVDGEVSTPSADYDLAVLGDNGRAEVNGTVHSLPWAGTFAFGTEVTLRAVADPGYEFIGWSGDLTGTESPTTVVVDEAKTINAEFVAAPCTLSVYGSSGQVLVDGVAVPLPWTATYSCSTSVVLRAVPNTCYAFSGWTGDISTSDNPCVVQVDGPVMATANFYQPYYTLSLAGTGLGSVRVNGVVRSLPWSTVMPCGTLVSLEAVPTNENWSFDHWSGDITGDQNPTSFVLTAGTSVTANFVYHEVTASCSADPDTVHSGGAAQLSGSLDDTLGHGMAACEWRDVLAFDPIVASALEGGAPNRVAVQGDYAYCAAGAGLTTYDISDPESPVYLGMCYTPGNAVDVAVQGTHAFVALDGLGLGVVSIADPANPVLVGTCAQPSAARAVAVSGDYAYVMGDHDYGYYTDGGLWIIDVTAPSAPHVVAFYGAEPTYRPDVAVLNGYAYVTAYYAGLRVVDVSNPFAPVEVGVSEQITACAVAAQGMYAYVTSVADLVVFDVGDPTNPVEVGRAAGGATYLYYTSDIAVSGPVAAVAHPNGPRLDMFDISIPHAPARISSSVPQGGASGVQTAGGHAYVAGHGGLSVMDISNPHAVTQVALHRTCGDATKLVLSQDMLYIGSVEAGVRMVDVSDIAAPAYLGEIVLNGCAKEIAADGTQVYAREWDRVRVVDTSDPAHPYEIGSWSASEGESVLCCPTDIAAVEGLVYLPGTNGTFYVLAAEAPGELAVVGTCDISADCVTKMSLSGDLACLTMSYGWWGMPLGLFLVDVSDPANPQVVGSLELEAQTAQEPRPVAVFQDHVYVGDGNDLLVVDISDRTSPTPIGKVSCPGRIEDIAVSGNRAYVGISDGRLRVYDISEPATPVLVGQYDGKGQSASRLIGTRVAVAGDCVALADPGRGVVLFDISSLPAEVQGSFDPSPNVPDPVYTAPQNHTGQDLIVQLEFEATCDGDPSGTDRAYCTLTVEPCAVMSTGSAQGVPGEVARVPVVVDLASGLADRFAFSAEVTPTGGAPALTGDLDFEPAAGMPAPDVVSGSPASIAVAWFNALSEAATGTVALGDILVPVPGGAQLGDPYEVCLVSVGVSIGDQELCVEASDCSTVVSCGLLLVGDAYPEEDDLNLDGDACDFDEFGDADEVGTDGLTWGDLITVFDAWAIPGSFPCDAGTWRVCAMDTYPPEADGDGAVTWGDVITTFDRWADPGRERPWRPVCDPEIPPEPQSIPKTMQALAKASVATALVAIQDAAGTPGGTARAHVTIDLAGMQSDRAAFAVEVIGLDPTTPAAEIIGFEPAAGLPQPLIISTPDGLAVAWLVPVAPGLFETASLGDLVVALPADASGGDVWRLHLTVVGASSASEEIAVITGADAFVTAESSGPHDVRIRRFQAPSSLRAGDERRFTIELENLTETPETVSVRLVCNGALRETWTVTMDGRERERLYADLVFAATDGPSAVVTVHADIQNDENPADNSRSVSVRVR